MASTSVQLDSSASEDEELRQIDISPDFSERPVVKGKFLFVGEDKFWVKGVSYGAFQPDGTGREYTDKEKLNRDFELMAKHGINVVRIPHTMPPRHLLDIAQQHGLHVMVGLSAEQYAGFLIDKKNAPNYKKEIREKVREVSGHPALLCYALGNEIQASLVRWIGRKRVERYLRRLYNIVKTEDPEGIVTYVNYPTTEYLQLPFLDMLSFNVYLENKDTLAGYLARLQNIAGERPLLMSEIGLDSLRNGESGQAESLEWQIRTAFEQGCIGSVVFSWTDEWYRAEAEVEDWAFGLTTREREPKPALASVEAAFSDVPFPKGLHWPRISVVVCSFNGSRTIRDTLDALSTIDYPDYEVIVVNDGSTDNTAEIASEYNVNLISTENRGLSNARNTGWQTATGEIIAYIDDDAFPDAHWLHYLAYTFMTTDCAGVGGPNIAPPGDGDVAICIANAPGGPVEVLLSDTEAEHIPGCNMAFRRESLKEIGGFDPRYRAAGDDVDLCWRIIERGWKIGFNATAVDWHHRRNSVRAYWKQQLGYGKAEALLEEKWPEKYNELGHTTWTGRLYGTGMTLPLWMRQHVYRGEMGLAPFQPMYQASPGSLMHLPLMPEWYLLVGLLATLFLVGFFWPPMLLFGILFVFAVSLQIIQAVISANNSNFMHGVGFSPKRWKLWSMTVMLHLIQPPARLIGRIKHGLTIWRHSKLDGMSLPVTHSQNIWTENWAMPDERPYHFESLLRSEGVTVVRGGAYSDWDLSVVGGLFGSARTSMAVEDHGGSSQYIRMRVSPCFHSFALVPAVIFAVLSLAAALDSAFIASAVMGAFSAAIVFRTLIETGFAIAATRRAFSKFERGVSSKQDEA